MSQFVTNHFDGTVESKMSFTVSDFSLAFLTFMSIVKNNLQ